MMMMNLASDEMRRNPFPVYQRMRSASPVLHVPPLDLWMIFDYDGVKRALHDHDAFSSSMEPAGRGNLDWFIFFDPPRHTKLRGLIMRAFTPRVVAGLEPRVKELSRALLDQTIELLPAPARGRHRDHHQPDRQRDPRFRRPPGPARPPAP